MQVLKFICILLYPCAYDTALCFDYHLKFPFREYLLLLSKEHFVGNVFLECDNEVTSYADCPLFIQKYIYYENVSIEKYFIPNIRVLYKFYSNLQNILEYY